LSTAFYDIEIVRGDTFGQSWQLIDTDNSPITIFNAALRLQFRASADSNVILLELSTANGGIVITDAFNGKFDVAITAAATALMTFETCVYDLELTDSSNVVKTLVAGTVFLHKDVTHD
jgi:hypothetical protein